MNIEISKKLSRSKDKFWYTFEWGKGPGERKAAGVFTYAKPKTIVEKNYNHEAIMILEMRRSELILERQSIGTTYIPAHKYKQNFLDYYAEYVANNKRKGNRHQEGSLNRFKDFLKKDHVAPIDITENLCERFRKFLLDNHTGKTPSDYFTAFKRVLRTATKEGYFKQNPAVDLRAKKKTGKKKESLEAGEYLKLLQTPIYNKDIKDAFIVCCYNGLRWCDIKALKWKSVLNDKTIFEIVQAKTDVVVPVTMHPVVQEIIGTRIDNAKINPNKRVFDLPSANGCNKSLKAWMKNAGINKHITWHCARLSFSILLQDANVDAATVALLLGHSSTRWVFETYKRHRPKNQMEAIMKLPETAILGNV